MIMLKQWCLPIPQIVADLLVELLGVLASYSITVIIIIIIIIIIIVIIILTIIIFLFLS